MKDRNGKEVTSSDVKNWVEDYFKKNGVTRLDVQEQVQLELERLIWEKTEKLLLPTEVSSEVWDKMAAEERNWLIAIGWNSHLGIGIDRYNQIVDFCKEMTEKYGKK